MRWASFVVRVREKRNMYRVVVRKAQGKGDTGLKFEYNNTIDLKEI